MKAAEGGNSTGRIFWGTSANYDKSLTFSFSFASWVGTIQSLTHRRLGVAKDEKKGFNELRRACDESLADGALDEPTSQPLDAKERKEMNVSENHPMFLTAA